jgi:hypothetical protein
MNGSEEQDRLTRWLEIFVQRGGSDLFLVVGRSPVDDATSWMRRLRRSIPVLNPGIDTVEKLKELRPFRFAGATPLNGL